ncbi:MAG: hypothetical protein ACRCY7_07670 [Cetobacterium sp.]|uniref:hypothetical protein n=1 Tax=Cetobacterium sp. TaxID=2071632 RepID=UPI003F329901
MRYFKILHRGKNNDFYLVEENGDYHVLEIFEDLEQDNIIIETDLFEYFCNGTEISAIMQWESISFQKAKHILINS